MRTIGATVCLILDHSWTPLEYMRVRITTGPGDSQVVSRETGPVYIGCIRCFTELPPHHRAPAPTDIVDR